tara:strand:+ start:158 stop:1024 length:867 start_codon:yes stop_codon:yes gene_type:complete
MINVLVTGCNGQLGSEIRELHRRYNSYKFLFTDFHDLNITNHESVNDFIKKNKIKIIINCAAYTAVDKAEREQESADRVNHLAVANFAKISKKNKIKLIHISTDYVFDGNSSKEYTETCDTNPISVYGKTKLAGEKAVMKVNPANSIIIRTSWLYSRFCKNFVKTILKNSKNNNVIKVVSDQFGSPTNASDLAKSILNIIPKINNSQVEIFHFSNDLFCSWFEFAQYICQSVKSNCIVESIESREIRQIAKRPIFSVMSCEKIKNTYKISIPTWQDSLKKFLNVKENL